MCVGREFRSEKNIIMLISFGGQVNTLKGELTERKHEQKLFLAGVWYSGGWESREQWDANLSQQMHISCLNLFSLPKSGSLR